MTQATPDDAASLGPQVQGILLAAGRGTRWRAAAAGDDDNKLLHRLRDGTPVVVAAAQALVAALPRCLAIVRREDTAVARALGDCGLTLVWAEPGSTGMGENLARAIQATPCRGDGDIGWVVALGDMPCLQAQTVRDVADALRAGQDLAAPFFRGRRGHPVGFSRRHGPELQTLRGDRGAAELLLREAHLLHQVHVNDPGILVDLDAPPT